MPRSVFATFILSLLFVAAPFFAHAAPLSSSISIVPDTVIQGEPLKISVENVGDSTAPLAAVKSISFNSKKLGVFLYEGKPTAFFGVDIKQKPATYTVSVVLADGTVLEKNVVVAARPKVEAPLGIPEKLGGNTPASAQALVSTLVSENAQLVGFFTQPKALWTNAFMFPLPAAQVVVTDPYGYSRQTTGYSITHKGTDLRAAEGTPVMAMNRGVVRLTKTFRDYGKTIVIDHGLGLMTFYMHLSKISVNTGELVQQGQVIGLSGQTGYADQPHLHITVRMSDISIDPMKFMALFK